MYVDGKEKDINKSIDALMTIDLEAGTHNIELIFEPKGLKLGIIISAISFVITILLCLYQHKKNN